MPHKAMKGMTAYNTHPRVASANPAKPRVPQSSPKRTLRRSPKRFTNGPTKTPEIRDAQTPKNEETIQRVDQAKARGDPERSTNMEVAKIAANRGANDEAKPKSSADIPEGLGALFRRRDVGDIGKRGRDVGGRDSGNDAPNKE